MYTIPRTGRPTTSLDAQPADGAPLLAFEPRAGGALTLAYGPAVKFYERCGRALLRAEFALWEGECAPSCLAWSVDSRLLAAVRPGVGAAVVFVYERVNYVWYCRKAVSVGEVVRLVWDEDALHTLTVYANPPEEIVLRFVPVPSTVLLLRDHAVAAVVDAHAVRLTNLSRAVLPPPLYHISVTFSAPVDAVCAATDTAILAILADSRVETVYLAPETLASPLVKRNPAAEERRTICTLPRPETAFLLPRMPVVLASAVLCAVEMVADADVLRAYQLSDASCATLLAEEHMTASVCAVSRSLHGACSLVVACSDRSVRVLDFDAEGGRFAESLRMEGAVSGDVVRVEDATVRGRVLTLVLDAAGVLSVLDLAKERAVTVSVQCTSFCVQAFFLSFTTRSHLLYCALLDKSSGKSYQADRNEIPSLLDALDNDVQTEHAEARTLPEGKGATRPIDRGSLIVTAVPNDVAIILQAPRGNLETICPRPVVFEAVDRYAKNSDYVNGFQLCRQQRIDMNHLVDADYDLFLKNVNSFVKQVGKASHLSIFLTFLRGNADKVNPVCDAVVNALKESEQSERYTNAIMTGLIRREPSDFEGALEQVCLARKRSDEEGAAALDYMFVLVKNEEKVYKYALGTYDLALSLFVARSSQMDPAEYSQELKRFSTFDETMRKYSIDMKLQRFDRALRHLHASGESKYQDCVALCHEHGLYEIGLTLFRNDTLIRPGLLQGYGKHLQSTRRYLEAAAVFIQNGEFKSACESYRSGGHWQLSASAAWQCEKLSLEEKLALLESLVEELVDGGRVREAAQVRASHLGDTCGAVELLCESEEWEAAFEVAGIHSARESSISKSEVSSSALKEILVTAATEGANGVLETVRENKNKLHERRKRLEVVRETKRAMAEQLGTTRDRGDADSDIFSASTASSLVSNISDVTFTSRTSAATSVYSTATSVMTGPLTEAKLEKQAQKRKRKAGRKRIRQGHPREEEYLVGYLQKLVPAEFLQKRVAGLGRALLFLRLPELLKEVIQEMQEYVEEAELLPADVLDGEGLRGTLSDRSWAESSTCIKFL